MIFAEVRPIYLEFPGIVVVGSIVIHQVDELELVPLTTLEIVGVVRWCDFDRSSSERHIDSNSVGDDRDTASVEGVDDEFTVKVLNRLDLYGMFHKTHSIPRVIRVDGDGGISQHSLRTSGSNNDTLI
jgi:hypothetical protein